MDFLSSLSSRDRVNCITKPYSDTSDIYKRKKDNRLCTKSLNNSQKEQVKRRRRKGRNRVQRHKGSRQGASGKQANGDFLCPVWKIIISHFSYLAEFGRIQQVVEVRAKGIAVAKGIVAAKGIVVAKGVAALEGVRVIELLQTIGENRWKG